MKKNKLKTMPIGKLLLSMSVPAMFSMLVNALYNIVDTIYISKVSEDALFVMGLVFPLQFVVISISLGGAIGTGALISRRLGENDVQEASRVATTGLILTIIHYVFLLVLGLFSIQYFLQLFTTNPIYLKMGYDYLSIIIGFGGFVFISIFFERIFQSQGNMLIPMVELCLGAILNILIDPILIFGLFNFPALGLKGAAIATVLSQFLAMSFIVLMYRLFPHDVKISLKDLKFKAQRIKEIYEVGLPVAIMNIMGSVTTTLINGVLVSFSTLAVTTFGIYFKLQSFVFMPVFGMNQGALPILAYNYGAFDFKRFKQTIKLYQISAFFIMLVGTLVFYFKTDLVLALFNPSSNLASVANPAIKTISLSFVFASISIVMNTVFQAFGRGVSSMMMSLLRQIIVLVPAAYFLGKVGGLSLLWYSFILSEIVVDIIYVPICLKMVKNKFKR